MDKTKYEFIKELLTKLFEEYQIKILMNLPVESEKFVLETTSLRINTFQLIIEPSGIIQGEFTLKIKREYIRYLQNEIAYEFIGSFRKFNSMIQGSSLRSIGKAIRKLSLQV